MSIFDSLMKIIAPKSKIRADGPGVTNSYNTSSPNTVLTVPRYEEHLTDLFNSRQTSDSRVLLRDLFRFDPDVSAAVHTYLTLANTEMIAYATDLDGQIDPVGTQDLMKIIQLLSRQTDYTAGFTLKQTMEQICADFRYMALLRGAIAAELVLDKSLAPTNIKHIDSTSLKWYEKKPNQYKPVQVASGSSVEVSLDIPTFFISFYRRDPGSIYPYSPFVSVINTVAARQQVINDLYRIMQLTGFPRMQVTVLEEIIRNSAPSNIRNDAKLLKEYVNDRITEIRQAFATIRVDQALVHTDATEISILNEKNPGASIDISNVIETLNAQNQAALKTMSTMLGRGTSGVNTSSVEARVAAMFADELNEPIAEMLQRMFSFILHQNGYQGFATVYFRKAELRPDLELEPQKTLKAQRLRQDLSDGLISDIEYHLEMYNRLPPVGAPTLSGTGFASAPSTSNVNAADVSPNTGPLDKSLAPSGGKMTKSNSVK